MEVLERLSRFFDRPLFPWKRVLVGFSLAEFIFESYLSWRQYKFLRRTKPPKALQEEISQDVFDKSQAYGRAKARFGLLSAVYGQVQNVAFVYYDVLPKLWFLAGSWMLAYFPERFSGEKTHSLVFMFVFSLIGTFLELPISYYHTFVLEEKFGFNKQTLGLWISDKLKGQALGIALGGPIGAAFLAIIQKTGKQFFFYLWLFTVVVAACMITIYPIVIVPIFNKLSPLDDGPLKTGLEKMASGLKFPLKEMYVIDGSKRSSHSNAYFTGMPWKKTVVIYDTLIEQSNTEEVIAVLGHELGHWSYGHTTKLFGISQANMLYIYALFSIFINNRSLYRAYGFRREQPIIIGFLLFMDCLKPLDFLVQFGMNVLSRRFEFQADQFSVKLGHAQSLGKALIKLQIKNLSTMDVDPWYSSYHYSHPILAERLGAMGWKRSGIADGKAADSEKPVKASDREL